MLTPEDHQRIEAAVVEAEKYSTLNADHCAAAASVDPGPGPLLSNAECTSGGEAIQIGAVTDQSLMNMIVVINISPKRRAARRRR